MMRLSRPQILLLHEQLLAESGGSPGLRSESMLERALQAPFQTIDEEEVYPSLCQKAACLCMELIKGQPFNTGSRVTGVHAMLVFLAVNGVELEYEQQELSSIIQAVSDGSADLASLADWILNHEA